MILPLLLLFQNTGGISCRRTVTNSDNICLVTSSPPSLTCRRHFSGKWTKHLCGRSFGIWTGNKEQNFKSSLSVTGPRMDRWKVRNWLYGCITDCFTSNLQFKFNFQFTKAVISITAYIINNMLRGKCFSQGLLISFVQVTTVSSKSNVIYHPALTGDSG